MHNGVTEAAVREIVRDFDKFRDAVDPYGTVSPGDYAEMAAEERIKLAHQVLHERAFYISAWEVNAGNIYDILWKALNEERITDTDTVWSGPDGSYVVVTYTTDLEPITDNDPDYSEYTDRGTVAEFLM